MRKFPGFKILTSVFVTPSFLSVLLLLLVPEIILLSTTTSSSACKEYVVAKNTMDLSCMSIEDLMNIEVTSASKKPERVADAPASVYVISREDIERYGYRTVSEALRRIVGLYVSSDRNYDYLGIRGYARPGDYNTRVLLLIDGLRVNDPLYNTSPIGDDLSVDIKSIERIEIVKGPGSALWGTNAMLAVVNLITRRASDISGSNLAQAFGSDGAKTSFFEYGSKAKGEFEFAGSLTTVETDGESSIYFPDINATATNVDGCTANRGYLTASYKNVNLFVTSGKINKNVPTGSYGTVFNDPRNQTEDQKTIAALSFERMVSKKQNGSLFARLFSNSYDFSGDYIYDLQLPELVVMKDTGSAKWWGGEVRYSADISPKLSCVSGFEYSKIKKLHLMNYYCDPYYLVNIDTNSSSTTSSYYLQTNYNISNSLRLIAGTRMDDYSTYGRSWSPRGAFIKKINDTSTVKLLWGKAFRAPDGYECDYTKAVTGLSDSGLVPEEITTTELVWDKGLGSRSRLVTSIYRFDLKNIITQVGDIQFENSGTVRSAGIESQLDYTLEDGATAYVNLTFLGVKETSTHQQVTNSPKFIAGAGLSLPILSDRFYFTPDIQIIGSRKTLAGEEIGASAIANLALSKRSALSGWDLSFGIYNLFNTPVDIPAAYEHAQDRIPQTGRQLRIQTSYYF